MSRSIYINPMNLSESEISTIYLVESGGVAAEPYKNEVEAIAYWLKNKILEDFSTDKTCLIYNVPQSLTRAISFIKNFTVEIVAYMSDNDGFGEGECTISGCNDIENGKIKSVDMEIVCCFNKKGRLFRRSFLNSFYHELNHAYDAYVNLNRKGNLNRYFLSGRKGTPHFSNNVINLIFYRLFSETEQNALVAGVFGDLKGMNSRRRNYNRYFYKTQFFQVYNEIKTKYKDAINVLSPDECDEIYNFMINNGVYIDLRFSDTIKSFKKALISKVENKLSKAFSHANKTAMFYYNTDGKDEPFIELKIKNK